ncbi:MAG: membrane protein insertase YidC, partial [Bryobacteraceae bacterium]|nr:membrane protein insertase YidC [Bryobacteraceae bacterium]
MADNEKPKPIIPGEEISVEKRMLLAFVLVGVVLLLSQFLFSPQAPQNTGATQNKPATTSQAKPPSGEPPPALTANSAIKGSEPPPAQTAASTEQSTTIDTKLYRIVFSNRGAVVRSWQLKNFKDSDGKMLELVNPRVTGKAPLPLALLFDSAKPSTDLDQALFAATTTDGGLGVRFDYSNGRTVAHKALKFAPDSYLFDL